MLQTNSESTFFLDLAGERLWDGDRAVPLARKPFSMLAYFLLHPDRLLEKSTILENVWPDTIVTEDSIKDYVHDIRSALRDDPSNPRFIETVRGRGYRYLGGIEAPGIAAVSMSTSVPSAPIAWPTVTMLSFVSSDGDGLRPNIVAFFAENIQTELCRFRSVRVAAAEVDTPCDRQLLEVPDRKPDVDFLVAGSVRGVGGRVQVTIQLVRAATGLQVWSERYVLHESDYFDTLAQVAEKAACAIVGRIHSVTQLHAAQGVVPQNNAYISVLRGRSIVADTSASNLRARQAFEQALSYDPTCARAYTGMAHSFAIDAMFGYGGSFESSLESALVFAQKGIELDEADSRTQWMMAHVLTVRREFAEAKLYFDRARTRNPIDADGLGMRGIFENRSGHPLQAIGYFTAAMELDPHYPGWYVWNLGVAHYATKQYERAHELFKFFTRMRPHHTRARWSLAATYAELGQIDEANAVVEEILRHEPDACLTGEYERLLPQVLDGSYMEHMLDGLRKAGVPE